MRHRLAVMTTTRAMITLIITTMDTAITVMIIITTITSTTEG